MRGARGEPLQGVHPRRTAIPVAAGDGRVEIVVEAASNPTFPQFRPSPLGSLETAGEAPLYTFTRADLVVVDEDAEALLHDFHVLDGVMRTMDVTDRRRQRLLRLLASGLDAIAGGASAAEARAVLAPGLASPTASPTHVAIATGHAHIDTAWLWPIRETVRKCVRTFASAVALMDEEPDFVFSCSQAQQYEWIREREPDLFERIVAKVAAGQWAPVGGMWVEADMNLPSGESIVRQIVHGQRWFAEHLGVTCTEVWIPDVFGYPGSLPQVFAAGGMRRFVTQKLSWNRTNRFPHQTFWWEGIDGTRVLTHFPPVDTYNAEMTPAELSESMERFAEHSWSDVSLIPFGYGDGGGGPTREMLARAARLADLDPMPRVELGTAARFFEHVEAEAAAGAPVPVWRGELYFETHRGTLTSQLRTKLGNRRCERLLREAELWMATDALGGVDVDPQELDECWQTVLTQQFHDILPGSSIAWVHADAEDAFTRVADDLEQRISTRLAPLRRTRCRRGQRGDLRSSRGRRDGRCGARAMARPNCCPTAAGRSSSSAPGLGLSPLLARPLPAGPAGRESQVVVTDRSMANGQLAVSWAPDGTLTSVIDVVRGRELIPAGRALPPSCCWLPTTRCSTTPGTSNRGRSTPPPRWVRPTRSRSRLPDRSSGSSPCGGRSARRRPSCATCCAPARLVWMWRSNSIGSTTSTSCRCASRSTFTPTRRRAASSSARCADRLTPRRRGTPPSSRSAPTATSTWPSRTSVSPCSTTGVTATAYLAARVWAVPRVHRFA